MAAILKYGRYNIHASISQFLNHLEKRSWCLNIHFQDQELQTRQSQIRKFDLNNGHFSKWPPEYTCFITSVSNSHRKKILLSKHTFSGPRITKMTIRKTQI